MAITARDVSTPREPEEITAQWLTRALSVRYPGVEVRHARVEDIIWGCSAKVRVRLDYNHAGRTAGLPPTLFVKAGFGRHGAIQEFTYEIEMMAYRDVVPTIPVNTPKCYFEGKDAETGQSVVIIEDLDPRNVTFGHALSPLNYEQVAAFLDSHARFHARWWDHPALKGDGSFPWVTNILEVQSRMSGYHAACLETETWNAYMREPRGAATPRSLHDRDRMARALERLQAFERTLPQTIIHGDDHLGNMYIEADGTPGFLDWQARVAPWVQGLTYFMISALDIEDRRKWERSLLSHYLSRLQAYGVAAPGFEEAWLAYRREVAFGLFVWHTNASKFQTESVNTANAVRFATAAIDHQTLDLLG